MSISNHLLVRREFGDRKIVTGVHIDVGGVPDYQALDVNATIDELHDAIAALHGLDSKRAKLHAAAALVRLVLSERPS